MSAGSALAQVREAAVAAGRAPARLAGTGLNTGSAYANGGNGQNLQLHTPGTGLVDSSTSLQLGTGSRYGQSGTAGQGQYGSTGLGRWQRRAGPGPVRPHPLR